MNFNNELKNEISNFISDDNQIMLIYTDNIMAVSRYIRQQPTNVHMIFANECNFLNKNQLPLSNNPKICIIHRPEMLDSVSDYLTNVLSKKIKIILVSSSRKFVYRFRKYFNIILRDYDYDFSEYFQYKTLNLLKQLYLYILTDGRDMYLTLFDTNKNLNKYIKDNIYAETGILHDKPIRDISSCFNTPANYIAVMYALANECRNSGNISKFLGMKQTTVSKYLSQLQSYGFIEYVTSLDAPEKSKSGKYKIISPYHHFWFRFMYEDMYTYGNIEKLNFNLNSNLRAYLIENHLIVYMKHIIDKRFQSQNISYKEWWNDDNHIDIVGVCNAKKTLYIGQYYCNHVHWDEYNELVSLSGKIKGYEKWKKVYIIFSSAGFDDELKAVSDANKHIILHSVSFNEPLTNTVIPLIIETRKKLK